MEPAVRGARPQSGITSTPSWHLELRWLENRNCSCECGRNSCRSGAAGNGILGCGDGAPKTGAKMRGRPRRPKSENWITESPVETPHLASYRNRAVCSGASFTSLKQLRSTSMLTSTRITTKLSPSSGPRKRSVSAGSKTAVSLTLIPSTSAPSARDAYQPCAFASR
jgi:hypothetical protein